MDGIEPSPGTQNLSPDVVPFGAFGQDYFRHRVMLVSLLSRPSQENKWLTENLSIKEMVSFKSGGDLGNSFAFSVQLAFHAVLLNRRDQTPGRKLREHQSRVAERTRRAVLQRHSRASSRGEQRRGGQKRSSWSYPSWRSVRKFLTVYTDGFLRFWL